MNNKLIFIFILTITCSSCNRLKIAIENKTLSYTVEDKEYIAPFLATVFKTYSKPLPNTALSKEINESIKLLSDKLNYICIKVNCPPDCPDMGECLFHDIQNQKFLESRNFPLTMATETLPDGIERELSISRQNITKNISVVEISRNKGSINLYSGDHKTSIP